MHIPSSRKTSFMQSNWLSHHTVLQSAALGSWPLPSICFLRTAALKFPATGRPSAISLVMIRACLSQQVLCGLRCQRHPVRWRGAGGAQWERGRGHAGSTLEHLAGLVTVSEEGYSPTGLAPSPWSSSLALPEARPSLLPQDPRCPSGEECQLLGKVEEPRSVEGLDLNFSTLSSPSSPVLKWIK